MKVTKITPRGACHGVVTAIQMVTNLINDTTIPRPIHILGAIVHNQYYSDAFAHYGIITLDAHSKTREQLLKEVTSGTVVFTAHGVSDYIRNIAKSKNLHIVDASCVDVLSTHNLVKEKISQGYEIIYIGTKNHPEPEGVITINKEKVHFVDTIESIDTIHPKTDKLLISNQTTLSLWDVSRVANAIIERFPTAKFHKEICTSTQIRQEAVASITNVQLIFVVGDSTSNNTKKLIEVGEEIIHTETIRIFDVFDIDVNFLKQRKFTHVAVTSGASTPTQVTKQVTEYLEQFDHLNPSTFTKPAKLSENKILPKPRKENY